MKGGGLIKTFDIETYEHKNIIFIASFSNKSDMCDMSSCFWDCGLSVGRYEFVLLGHSNGPSPQL